MLDFDFESSVGTIAFAWNCGYKYIYAQSESIFDACQAFRKYSVTVDLEPSSVFFADDACGTLSLDDDLMTTSSSSSSASGGGVYLYLGADNRFGSAKWSRMSVTGVLNDFVAPDPSQAPTHPPTPLPTFLAPSLAPGEPPTPFPSLSLSPTTTTLSDEFDSFNGEVWSQQCGGCVYSGGDLQVFGDRQMMRTVGTLFDLTRIQGSLRRNENCDDHFLAISTSANMGFSYGREAGEVKFVWRCSTKYLYGQEASTSVECDEDGAIGVDVGVGPTTVTFTDDRCGTLRLDDTLASDASSSSSSSDGGGGGGGLYVYVGADNDYFLRSAQWEWVSMTGTPSWHAVTPTATPSARPTLAGDFAVFDYFSEGFKGNLWVSPCAGCLYYNDALFVSGSSMLMRSLGGFYDTSRVVGRLLKNDRCDDHVVALSRNQFLSFSWREDDDTVKFVWRCDDKEIIGSKESVEFDDCDQRGLYNIDISVGPTSVAFTDDVCGTLTLDETIGNGESPLYLYLGADNDYGTARWDWVGVAATPLWDVADDDSTPPPSALPSPPPTSADLVAVGFRLGLSAEDAGDLTEAAVVSSVAFTLPGVTESMIKNVEITLLTGEEEEGAPPPSARALVGNAAAAASSSSSSSSTGKAQELPSEKRLPSHRHSRRRLLDDDATLSVRAEASFEVAASLSELGFGSAGAMEASLASDLEGSVSDGTLSGALSLACGGCSIQSDAAASTGPVGAYPTVLPTPLPPPPTLPPTAAPNAGQQGGVPTLADDGDGQSSSPSSATAAVVWVLAALVLVVGGCGVAAYMRAVASKERGSGSDGNGGGVGFANVEDGGVMMSSLDPELDQEEEEEDEFGGVSPEQRAARASEFLAGGTDRRSQGLRFFAFGDSGGAACGGEEAGGAAQQPGRPSDRRMSLDAMASHHHAASAEPPASMSAIVATLTAAAEAEDASGGGYALADARSPSPSPRGLLADRIAVQSNREGESEAAVRAFLGRSGLDTFANGFLQFGISSVEDLCDTQLISDAELISELGMNKVQVRKFRKLVTTHEQEKEEEESAPPNKAVGASVSEPATVASLEASLQPVDLVAEVEVEAEAETAHAAAAAHAPAMPPHPPQRPARPATRVFDL